MSAIEGGSAQRVYMVNASDISSGGGGGGGSATLAEQQSQTALLTAEATLIGAVSETAPANDTANSGLNGRLQRIAVRLTTLLAQIGATNETASSSDTATSGLNGRLQRISQQLTTLAGYSDGVEGLLTSLSALFPSSIGQKTKAGSLSVTLASDADALPAGENVIGAVAGKTALVTVNPTVSTSPAYSSGDSIGGKFTLTSALRVSGGTGYLQSIMLLDRANQKPAGTILIYNADPTNATLTDNSALSNSTDDQKIIASIPVTASDYTTISSKAYANLNGLGRGVKAASGTTLYASFVTTSTPTFSATTDIQLIFTFIQD